MAWKPVSQRARQVAARFEIATGHSAGNAFHALQYGGMLVGVAIASGKVCLLHPLVLAGEMLPRMNMDSSQCCNHLFVRSRDQRINQDHKLFVDMVDWRISEPQVALPRSRGRDRDGGLHIYLNRKGKGIEAIDRISARLS